MIEQALKLLPLRWLLVLIPSLSGLTMGSAATLAPHDFARQGIAAKSAPTLFRGTSARYPGAPASNGSELPPPQLTRL